MRAEGILRHWRNRRNCWLMLRRGLRRFGSGKGRLKYELGRVREMKGWCLESILECQFDPMVKPVTRKDLEIFKSITLACKADSLGAVRRSDHDHR